MIYSIFQIFAFQLLFLAVYDFFLKGETFFDLNRIFLLITPVLGIVLPFISFSFIQENIPQEYVLRLPAVIVGSEVSETVSSTTSIWWTGLLLTWCFGMLLSTLLFIWKLHRIYQLKAAGTLINEANYKLILLPKTDLAFSFFNTIFLGENISKENKSSIIAHEKIHIEQKHSLDLQFFEILRIIFWFNPLVYIFQNRISTLHEFIADAKVINPKDKKQYYEKLLSEVFQTEKISFINTFFNQSLIKKRIIMLQKTKSRKIVMLKYILILPIICGMLIYTSCSHEPKAEKIETLANSDSEVMTKINELENLIMEKGTMTSEEKLALMKVTVKKLPGDEDINGEDVPFAAIEKVPAYPGCSGDTESMKICISTNIAKFINSNFNTGIAKDLKISGLQRIAVQFKIDKTGKVVNVRARSLSHTKELEEEAIRVVKLLPQMQPGEQKGEKVGVLYSLPIVFDVIE